MTTERVFYKSLFRSITFSIAAFISNFLVPFNPLVCHIFLVRRRRRTFAEAPWTFGLIIREAYSCKGRLALSISPAIALLLVIVSIPVSYPISCPSSFPSSCPSFPLTFGILLGGLGGVGGVGGVGVGALTVHDPCA